MRKKAEGGMQLGEALRNYRKRANLQQKQMAGIIGVTKEYYNKIENARVVVSGRLFKRIVDATGISVNFSYENDQRKIAPPGRKD